MMLRKRTGSFQKDQSHMSHLTISDTNSDYYSQSHALGINLKNNSISNIPCLFVGLGPKGFLDSDSIRSPTSPFDVTLLSNLGNPVRSPVSSSPHEWQKRCWDCSKVGLSIIDSLEDCSKFSGKILRSSESKKISLSPQMMIKTANFPTYMDSFEAPKSLPKDFSELPYTQNGSKVQKGESTIVFEIGETHLEHEPFVKTRCFSLDSCSPFKDLSFLACCNSDSDSENFASKDMTIQVSSPPHFIGGSQNSNTLLPAELNLNPVSICSSAEFIKSLSASEIELSEDYTCVISRGPNPKTTHIFGDCILETDSNDLKIGYKNEGMEEGGVSLVVNANQLRTPNQYSSSGDFLSFCYHCNKKLQEGKDIFIYRGEKAFCSLTCRALEIMTDEEQEKSNPSSENSPNQEFGEPFESGIITGT